MMKLKPHLTTNPAPLSNKRCSSAFHFRNIVADNLIEQLSVIPIYIYNFQKQNTLTEVNGKGITRSTGD